MKKLYIEGGRKLSGSLNISTSKNASLPIMAGSVLSGKKIVIKNLPKFTDINSMKEILTTLGANITTTGEYTTIDSESINSFEVTNDLMKKLRASIFLLGPIIARFKKAKVAYPGGCDIGSRPIDLHLKGLRALGVRVIEEHGYIFCYGEDMKGDVVNLDFPSVGATENIMMAAVLTKGITTIINAAKEPEVSDLANYLNKMGAKIRGAGSSTIIIEGVEKLNDVEYEPIKDRIIAGTYMIASAITGGDVEIKGVKSENVYPLIKTLNNCACNVTYKNDKIRVTSNGNLKAVGELQTNPYPAFPTDLQAPFMALQTVSEGISIITENLFESRFKHVAELKKMGAKILIKDNMAIVSGVSKLFGAEVSAHDLRAGAAMVVAGLRATGYTIVDNIKHIDRGYECIESELKTLGAYIKRIDT